MNRSIAPNYSQPERLELQFPEEILLDNGCVLYWLKDVKDDSVKLDIEWNAGSKYQSKKLVANFTNKLILSGNAEQSGPEISERIDYYGGYIQHEIDRDHAGVVIYGLREHMGMLFKLFSEAFESVDFPENEFEKQRSIALSSFRIQSKKVKNLCQRRFNKAIFGTDSAYGQAAEEEDFKSICTNDIKSFYQSNYKERSPVLFLVGNVDESFIDSLKNWSKTFTPSKDTPISNKVDQEKGRIANLEVPEAIQSAIRIGRLMFNKKHEDYFKFQLLSTVLGGYFGSRLMTNIREDKGYTYGIGCDLVVMEDAAYFIISTEVGIDVREQTINEVFYEIERLQTEPIPDEELLKVKNYMLGDFLRHANGPISMMENFKNIYFNDLPRTYYTDFIHAIHETTANDLRDMAQRYLQKEDLTIVTVG